MKKENKRKLKKNIIKKNTIIVIITIIGVFNALINNKTIEKNNPKTTTKALDQEGNTYRLVTSADNSHTTITHKVSTTPTVLTWSSPAGEQYPWTQDENGIWISGNQGIKNSTSTLESEEFDYIKGTTLTINYTYSIGRYDFLYIDLINQTNNTTTRIVQASFDNTSSSFDYTTSNYTWTMDNGGTGRYKIRAIFNKRDSTIHGQDSGYIKTSTYYKEDENGEILEIDQKTMIHDGGFVIYQLTDEEIETDPNGTSVVINDTNKDTAQSTRNQYVWIPLQNLEDIVKTNYNRRLQFGQNYIFSNTSIIKNTGENAVNLSEPRLVEEFEKTKKDLQRYSYIFIRENYLNKMQEDFARTINSINKYKGFYIGRYETGDDYSHKNGATQNCYINPKVVKYNSNIGYVTWYESYKKLERLSAKTGEYVETGMIYSSLFDYALIWLNETDTRGYYEISGDSGTWGNYYNNSFKYKESANGEEKTKNSFVSKTIPTGGITEIVYNGEIYSNSPTSSNNIYDITGNIAEWTKSRYFSSSRKAKGGYISENSNGYPASQTGSYTPNSNDEFFGVRAMLVIRY